jgi:hypothetical protein
VRSYDSHPRPFGAPAPKRSSLNAKPAFGLPEASKAAGIIRRRLERTGHMGNPGSRSGAAQGFRGSNGWTRKARPMTNTARQASLSLLLASIGVAACSSSSTSPVVSRPTPHVTTTPTGAPSVTPTPRASPTATPTTRPTATATPKPTPTPSPAVTGHLYVGGGDSGSTSPPYVNRYTIKDALIYSSSIL